MSIYFIQEQNNSEGLIKIGLSGKPQRRLKSMQTNSPVLLEIFVTLPGNEQLEEKLHEMFAENRIRGEWFKPSQKLIAFIDLAIDWH